LRDRRRRLRRRAGALRGRDGDGGAARRPGRPHTGGPGPAGGHLRGVRGQIRRLAREPPAPPGRTGGMRRTLLVLIGVGLVLAPAAAAKGPAAVLTSGPGPGAGELSESRHPPAPLLIAVGDGGHVDSQVRRAAASIEGAVAFKTTMVFPKAGRWRLMLVAGSRRFKLPALRVGSATAPKDYVAFPVGSEAARQGGGGELVTGEQRVGAGGGEARAREGLSAAGAAPRGLRHRPP